MAENKCPKCGEPICGSVNDEEKLFYYRCGTEWSKDDEYWHSKQCRINLLEQRLAAVEAERNKLLAERDKWRAAAKYVQHWRGCDIYRVYLIDGDRTCTCGLDQLLAYVRGGE